MNRIRKSPYWKLTAFIGPLALTATAQDIGEQALNRSLVSSSDRNALAALASFVIAYKILYLINGGIEDCKYLTLVYLKDRRDRKKLLFFGILLSLCSSSFMLIVGLTSFGEFLIETLHKVNKETGDKTRKAMLILSVYPFIESFIWHHVGLLTRFKHSLVIGFSCLMDFATKMVVVTSLIGNNIDALYIPLIAAYASQLVRLIIIMSAYYKYVNHKVNEGLVDDRTDAKPLTFLSILRSWLPLLAVKIIHRISRPIANAYVSRDRPPGTDEKYGIEQLAVLSICFPVSRVIYSWLNEMKSLEPTFTRKDENGRSEVTVQQVRRFGFGCCLVVITLMIILFWIPGLLVPIITNVSNVSEETAKLTDTPMKVLSILPIPVALRDLTTGWIYKNKHNQVLYPGVVIRLVVLLVLLNVLTKFGIYGATMGASAVLSAFLAEAICLSLVSFYIKRKYRKARNNLTREASESRTQNATIEDDKRLLNYETSM